MPQKKGRRKAILQIHVKLHRWTASDKLNQQSVKLPSLMTARPLPADKGSCPSPVKLSPVKFCHRSSLRVKIELS